MCTQLQLASACWHLWPCSHLAPRPARAPLAPFFPQAPLCWRRGATRWTLPLPRGCARACSTRRPAALAAATSCSSGEPPGAEGGCRWLAPVPASREEELWRRLLLLLDLPSCPAHTWISSNFASLRLPNGTAECIDARELAPGAANETMFVGACRALPLSLFVEGCAPGCPCFPPAKLCFPSRCCVTCCRPARRFHQRRPGRGGAAGAARLLDRAPAARAPALEAPVPGAALPCSRCKGRRLHLRLAGCCSSIQVPAAGACCIAQAACSRHQFPVCCLPFAACNQAGAERLPRPPLPGCVCKHAGATCCVLPPEPPGLV